MAARHYSGVQSAAREARRVLGLAEAAALWEGRTGGTMLSGGDPLQRRLPVLRGGSAVAARGQAVAARPAAAEETLSALADRIGSARGGRRLRTAEIYHMLFQHLRHSAPGVVEILAGCEPAGGAGPGQLWAEYFPGAKLTLLAPQAAPGATTAEGAVWAAADPETRPGFAAALDGLEAPMLVVDDGSHASHHQQNAFLELFPRLAPGGFYVLEGLRAQPEGLERPGITRSADLFRIFAEKRRFEHSDAPTQAALAALAPGISTVLMLQAGHHRARRDFAAVIHKR